MRKNAGAANAIVASCLEGKHQALMASALFAVYEDVLSRESSFTKDCRGPLLNSRVETPGAGP